MQQTKLRGSAVLNNPTLNRGTAFTDEERAALGLHGLLPPVVETLEQQCTRAYAAYQRKNEDIERHIYLRQLQDANETLFYALLYRHITEMTPMIYNPVVAEGCTHFSHIYRRPRGLFLSYPLAHRLDEMLENRPHKDVDVIVVTDGERILGIGDQGAGGMGIPIGKLSLYTLIGGIEPSRTLPILLDVGTNNEERLHDPEYIGWRHERITGREYFDFVDQFVRAVKRKLPHVLLQWEDFAKPHARPILDLYRDSLCTFNDDIQGTAAVAVGALYCAMFVTKKKLADQRVVILGAGGAGTGIAEYILADMTADGLPEEEARSRFYVLNAEGLITGETPNLSPVQRKFAQAPETVAGWRNAAGKIGLAEVIHHANATILVGVSTKANQFTEPIVREMASKVERPIIFPLSNPDTHAEAIPEDLVRWTDGRCLIATGAPFAPVNYNGKTIHIAQCNNFYIFPAVGLAVTVSGANRVTDRMLLAAARALAECSPALHDPAAPLLPPLEEIRKVSMRVAAAAAVEAQRSGHAPKTTFDIGTLIAERFWVPDYPASGI